MRSYKPTLAGTAYCFKLSAKGKINQLDVVDGNIGTWISALDPFGKLPARDCFWFQQVAVPVVHMAKFTVGNERLQLLVVGIKQLVINNFGKHFFASGQLNQFV